jgi:hypothetical protein
MNFMWDGALADFQDKLFDQYQNGLKISDQDLKDLKNNKAVSIAKFLAPCNLVVRHYCLIDLIEGKDNHKDEIEDQCELLSGFPCSRLWQEGYSYYCYTKKFLTVYCQKFSNKFLSSLIEVIDTNFRKTSYERNGVSYPVPLGDIWDSPLEESLQQPKQKAGVDPFVRICHPIYRIRTKALWFNLHTETADKIYNVETGIPVDMKTMKPFKFYTGYKNKYPTKWSELKAILNIKRLLSFL